MSNTMERVAAPTWQLTPIQRRVAEAVIPAIDHYDVESPNPFVTSVIVRLPHEVASLKLGPDVADNMSLRRVFHHRKRAISLDLDLGARGENMLNPLETVVMGAWYPRHLTVSPEKGYVGLRKAVKTVQHDVHNLYDVDLVVRSAPSNIPADECRERYRGKSPYETAAWCARLAVASGIGMVMCAGPEIEAVKSVDPTLRTIVTGCRLPDEPYDGHDPQRVWTPQQIFDAGGDYIATGHQIMAAAMVSLEKAEATFKAYLDNGAQAARFQALKTVE